MEEFPWKRNDIQLFKILKVIYFFGKFAGSELYDAGPASLRSGVVGFEDQTEELNRR